MSKLAETCKKTADVNLTRLCNVGCAHTQHHSSFASVFYAGNRIVSRSALTASPVCCGFVAHVDLRSHACVRKSSAEVME